MNVKNVRRVIEDSLLYTDNIEQAFIQAGKYLLLVGENGIILNPDKFVFGNDTVDWAGIRVSVDKVEPLPVHVRKIVTIIMFISLTHEYMVKISN
jgi:hypothetical protein